MQATRPVIGWEKLVELEKIISKMHLSVCRSTVLPEFGLHWNEVSRTVKKNRLPMESASIARVLCHFFTNTMPPDNLDDILSKLRLHLVAREKRSWHVLYLHGGTSSDVTGGRALQLFPQRVHAALRSFKRNMTPEVQSVMVDDLIYLSVQFISESKAGSVVYVATPPGHPVALVSTIISDKLLKACVQGLGYSSYTRGDLHGTHIPSLLRIADPAWGATPDQMAGVPPYEPRPVLTANGIDYTKRGYDEQYVNAILGPDPPVLNELTIKTASRFHDKTLIDKTFPLTLRLKSDNVADTLKGWVKNGAIAPESTFIHMFHKIKSNQITLTKQRDHAEESE